MVLMRTPPAYLAILACLAILAVSIRDSGCKPNHVGLVVTLAIIQRDISILIAWISIRFCEHFTFILLAYRWPYTTQNNDTTRVLFAGTYTAKQLKTIYYSLICRECWTLWQTAVGIFMSSLGG